MTAWSDLADEELARFAAAHACATIEEYVATQPRVPLGDIAALMGPSINAVSLARRLLAHATDTPQMSDVVRDLVCRELQTPREDGAVSLFSFDMPQPYRDVAQAILALPELVPADWQPTSKDDSRLVALWNAAVATLPLARQQTIAEGAVEPKVGDVYRRVLDRIGDSVDVYSDEGDTMRSELAQLPLEHRMIYAAHWCNSEVGNGGLAQFFFNVGGLAPEAIAGLAALGLSVCSRVVAEAARDLGTPFPRDATTRIRRLRALGDETHAAWRELESEYFAESERFDAAADAYVLRGMS